MKKSFLGPLGSSFLVLALSSSLMMGCRAKTTMPGAGNGDIDMSNPVTELPIVVPAQTQGIMANPFVVTASAKQNEYKTGAPVDLHIEVTNTSKRKAQLQFTSGQSFDFSATREDEKEPAWSWAMDKMFAQMMRSEFLEPGKSLKFDATWKGATPGTYSVVGMITANGGLNAAPFTVVVK